MKNKLHYIAELGKAVREKNYEKIKNVCSEMKAINMINEKAEQNLLEIILDRYKIFEG